METALYQIFGHRDENENILIQECYSMENAMYSAASFAKCWKRIEVVQNDIVKAVIALDGITA